jgi:hypothetical protein
MPRRRRLPFTLQAAGEQFPTFVGADGVEAASAAYDETVHLMFLSGGCGFFKQRVVGCRGLHRHDFLVLYSEQLIHLLDEACRGASARSASASFSTVFAEAAFDGSS